MVSVIVPVYMVENTIERCVDSIIKQSNSDWELILVDDGSTDRSGDICEKLALADSRIHVVHKKNGGASSARNAGLDIAKGEWIVFVDGDDTISPNYLQLIVDNSDNEILIFGMAQDKFTPDGRLTASECKLLSIPLSMQCSEIADNFSCLFQSITMDSSCCKAFRKNIIDSNSIRFNPEMICYEDFDFVIRYIACCKGSLMSLPHIVYHYIQSTDYNPLQRRNNRNIASSIFILLDTLSTWLKPEELNGINLETYFYLLSSKFGLILDQLRNKKYVEAKSVLKEIANNSVYRKYQREIVSHSSFFKRRILKYNHNGLRYPVYILNKLRP